MIYQLLDILIIFFHTALIIFNLFGWMYKPLRRWNLITLTLTAFSWFVLGAFYGFGYCFLTDWHWQIREKLGYANPFNSYIQFLIVTLLRVTISEIAVNILTGTLFLAALVMSVITNLRYWRKSRN